MYKMYSSKLISYVLLVMVLGFCGNLSAQTTIDDLRKEIDEIKQGQQAMQKDLQEIKALLSKLAAAPAVAPARDAAPAPPSVKGIKFDIGDNPVKGDSTASLMLVEFSDYQCPFCSRYARETYPLILKQYVETGLIRYVMIDQPLSMHPQAEKAAEASHCAEEQGKFWEIHELMMRMQDNLDDLAFYARSLKLDTNRFQDCLDDGKYEAAVLRDMELADQLGISGVPGFVIAAVDEKNPRQATGILMLRGAVPFSNFKREIDAALLSKK